jgi:K+-sensing histidine kinase KdpD
MKIADSNKNNSRNQKQEEVIVSIKDTGTGIDSEILPRLFTKFAAKSEVVRLRTVHIKKYCRSSWWQNVG